jgi:hypothetical protein
MPGADFFDMEADFEGGFQYGGGFRGADLIKRRILEAAFNMEADSGGGFTYRGRFWRRLFY